MFHMEYNKDQCSDEVTIFKCNCGAFLYDYQGSGPKEFRPPNENPFISAVYYTLPYNDRSLFVKYIREKGIKSSIHVDHIGGWTKTEEA
jgi:hypothetical protein